MEKKVYNILELNTMPRQDLLNAAKDWKVDTLNKTKQNIIYEILDEQSHETVNI